MDKLDALTEAECYARCYGERGLGYVRVVGTVRPYTERLMLGETLLQAFEDSLVVRAPEAA